MVKIVGKTFIYIFLFCVVALKAAVLMEIRTENGVRDRVVVGQPFIIDVTIDDVYGSVSAPTIAGLEQFNAKRTGMYMSSVNGKSTTRYSYQVRIDSIGTYTIGPAVVHYQQKDMTSNTVTISVTKDVAPVVAQSKSNSQKEAKAFLRLMVDKDVVVVGQKIGCSLRFYYQDPSLSLVNVGMPELSGFDVKTVGNLESGVADVNGQQYRYAQWRWDMYPTKPGEFVLPAYNLDYEVSRQDNHLLGGLFMFINNHAERKRVYSNAITIKVAPLPYFDGKVDGIGSFERFTAQIKPGIAKEGEGMVLSLEIEGFGNFDTMAVPKLTMPAALKYYDSNNLIIMPTASDELPKKRFEFIVQGLQQGDWEIPQQLFTFFDVEKNNYITLRTSPLCVSIKPGAGSIKKEEAEEKAIIVTPTNITAVDGLMPINSVGYWYCIAERKALPWWLFFVLFFIPILYVIYPYILQRIVFLRQQSFSIRRRYAFKLARKKIDQACKFSQDKELYVIFAQLILSCRRQQEIEKSLLIEVNTILRSKDVPQVLIDEWNSFCECIMRAAYAQIDYNNNHSNELYRMAKQWIDRLEKIL